jgi:hypothetical protein
MDQEIKSIKILNKGLWAIVDGQEIYVAAVHVNGMEIKTLLGEDTPEAAMQEAGHWIGSHPILSKFNALESSAR